jgi:hypothetical protein
MYRQIKSKLAKIVTQQDIDALDEENKDIIKRVRHGHGVNKYGDGNLFAG